MRPSLLSPGLLAGPMAVTPTVTVTGSFKSWSTHKGPLAELENGRSESAPGAYRDPEGAPRAAGAGRYATVARWSLSRRAAH
jgi:hypothetical protein